jgi:hypothetical protein
VAKTKRAITRSPRLERAFPKLLAAGYEITSDDTSNSLDNYNCIAWAAHDVKHGFWWPLNNGHWPIRERELTISCFVKAFESLGYHRCGNSRLEWAYEKVALYAIADEPKHMARQLRDGSWTSKCGDWEDLRHLTLDAVESYGPRPFGEYGAPVLFMKRLLLVSVAVRASKFLAWNIKRLVKR